jgi:mRNA-degrading endonuclease RelE of RelBE toxin-antitoxin system
MTILSKQAQKTIQKADKTTATRLRKHIERIERNEGDIVKLKLTRGGMKEELYRYKIEHYRIIFKRERDLVIQSITTKTNTKFRNTKCF